MLTKTVAMVWARGMLHKAVAHTVLLYGSDGWVLTGAMLKVLEGFHHRSAQWIAVMTYWRAEGGEWDYPPVADVV